MKKLALSLLVIAASGGYVWSQSATQPAGDLLGSAAPGALQPPVVAERRDAVVTVIDPPAAPPVIRQQTSAEVAPPPPVKSLTPVIQNEPAAPSPAVALTRSAFIDVPLPRLRPVFHAAQPRVTQAPVTRVAAAVASNASLADGTYTGPETDAYYGPMRIQAIVQGGQLVGIKVLEYPSDRRTSVAINRQALPMLRDEVIAAQSARVDIISGATLTSEAFIESLDGALSQAGGTSL